MHIMSGVLKYLLSNTYLFLFQKMVLFYRWSSCQVADHEAEDSENEFVSDIEIENETDEEEGFGEDLNDVLNEVSDIPSQKTQKRYSVSDIIKLLAQNEDDIDKTVNDLLQDITEDSLDHLSSQNTEHKQKKSKNLKRKIERLRKSYQKLNKKKRESVKEETFLSESQDSFVQSVREEKKEAEEATKYPFEDEEEKIIVFRKPLDQLKDANTMKDRVKDILAAVQTESRKQKVTDTQLLSYLLYLINYIPKRKSALEMLKIFKDGSIEEIDRVPIMKTVAIVSRGRMGRSTFTYVRRMLKPSKVEGGGNQGT